MQHGDQEDRMGHTKKEMLNRIATALGGRAAEIVYYGLEDGISTGASGDLHTATELAKKMLCEFGMDKEYGMSVVDYGQPFQAISVNRRVNNILNEQMERAIDCISNNSSKMDNLVQKLLEQSHLNKEEISLLLSEKT